MNGKAKELFGTDIASSIPDNIELVFGRDIFSVPTDAIVNPVNLVGVMGAGLAKEVKDRFPEAFISYKEKCRFRKLKIGTVHVVKLDRAYNPSYIINFPTKRHYKEKSKLDYINSGLSALKAELSGMGAMTVSIPLLGCGLGMLDPKDVMREIVRSLSGLGSVKFLVFVGKDGETRNG